MKAGITMIGGTSAGKTCYLYAMSNLMSRSQNGFTFVPVAHRVGLNLKRVWSIMQHKLVDGKVVQRGEWPPSTVEHTTVEFYFKYYTKPLATFAWHDYRGGLLNTLEDEQEQDQLFQTINSSSCLIVCIAAETLQGLIKNDGEAIDELTTYADILERYRAEKNAFVPVVFAILKADKLKSGEFTQGISILKDDIFAQFFHREKEDGWFLMFVAVSLGEFEDRHEVNEVTKRALVFGEFSAVNVHLPVFFAIRCGLIYKLRDAENRRKSLTSEMSSANDALRKEQDRGWFDVFWNGSKKATIQEAKSSASSKLGIVEEEIDGLKNDLSLLDSELFSEGSSVVQVYYNGDRVSR